MLPRCHKVNIKLVLGWFLGQEILNLHDPYIQYYCTVWYHTTDNWKLRWIIWRQLLPSSPKMWCEHSIWNATEFLTFSAKLSKQLVGEAEHSEAVIIFSYYKIITSKINTIFYDGYIHLLDWNTGLDYWTGIFFGFYTCYGWFNWSLLT